MDIKLENCNNIDSGIVQISKSKLNIKFGTNGTGKSTIAKAIKYKIEEPDKLKELMPFKLQKLDSKIEPEVIIPDEIKSVFIFDEEYLNQFIYKDDELVANSFEIFIKSPNYIKSVQEIENILENIKTIFQKDESLNETIKNFESLANSFSITNTGKLSKSSAVYKALENGNLLKNIPEELNGYSEYLKNDQECTSWLGWQMKGKSFMGISDNCPFCTSPTKEKEEIINLVSNTYDKNIISKLIIIMNALNNLGDYFSDTSKTKLTEITTKNTGLEEEEINYIQETKKQIDIFLKKLKNLQLITPTFLAENDKVEDQIKSLDIKLDYLDRFNSLKSQDIIKSLNKSLSDVLIKITDLKRAIGQQNSEIKALITKHKKNIDQFLKKAGYKYEVIITDKNKDYKLRLKHIDSDNNIQKGNQYLSFGEKNAFGLVLFMYEALFRNPDLIILDDPISSFDKHKKYAIMDMLFRENNSFKGKTVLMLTHDIEPIIDTVKVLHNKFKDLISPTVITTKTNKLKELEITKDDLLSISQIYNKIIKSDDVDEIIKLIYLRRYYEVIDDKGNEYEVLSNLLHKRSKTETTDQRKEKIDDNYQKLSSDDLESGLDRIKIKNPNFDYDKLLEKLNDDKLIILYNETNNSFVKIILFRILLDGIDEAKKPDNVFMKFVNEIYHIENDFLFQLDPEKFDLTPEFIIKGCDDFVKSLGGSN